MPLEGYVAFTTNDSARAEAEGSKTMSPHRLRPTDDGTFNAQLRAAHLSSSTLVGLRYTGGIYLTATAPTDYYTLHVPLRGRLVVHRDNTDHQAGPGAALVLSPGDHLSMRWDVEFAQLVIKVPVETVLRRYGELTGRPESVPLIFDPELSPTTPAWVPSFHLAMETVDMCRNTVPPAVASAVEQTLITNLLLSQPHDRTESLFVAAPSRARRAVQSVAEEMRARAAEPVSIEEFARNRRVSVRSLQDGFRAEFGLTPSAYLLRLRLDLAHELLANAHPRYGDTVSDIAYKCGFTHLGRFAQTYRTRYGMTPSDTLRGE